MLELVSYKSYGANHHSFHVLLCFDGFEKNGAGSKIRRLSLSHKLSKVQLAEGMWSVIAPCFFPEQCFSPCSTNVQTAKLLDS
jgi:hypothetical protein